MTGNARSGNDPPRVRSFEELLEFDGRASFFKLFLGGFRSILGNAFEDVGRSTFDQFLRIGKTKARSNFTDCLDDSDLVGTGASDDDVEFGLLFGSFGRTGGGWTSGHGSSSGDTPGFFELFNEVDSFQDGELAEFFY